MLMLKILMESVVVCFILMIAFTVGMSNGAVGLASLYEKEVQERAIKLGLITQERIDRNALLFNLFGIAPGMIFMLVAVYGINGARGFWEGFWQLCVIMLIEGLFDRLFVDWYWVGHTKTWIIPGTEDLMPYIYGKTLAGKWAITVIGYPVLSAILAAIMMLVIK